MLRDAVRISWDFASDSFVFLFGGAGGQGAAASDLAEPW